MFISQNSGVWEFQDKGGCREKALFFSLPLVSSTLMISLKPNYLLKDTLPILSHLGFCLQYMNFVEHKLSEHNSNK